MTIALWIIAICEVIRILQNSIQLSMLLGERELRKNLNNEFIDSLKKDNREWVEDTLRDFLERETNESGRSKEEIYPLVVVEDRYGGTYSGGAFTAWNLYLGQIPRDIDGDDVTCINFWGSWGESYKGIVGLGKTPGEAIADLRLKMNEQAERSE